MPPIILASVNLKGGVGKTALAVNFAAYCGSIGKKTLLIDLDPQTNATFSCMDVAVWEQHARDHGTVADLLGARSHSNAEGNTKTAQDVIRTGVFANVDLIPSHLDLFSVDLDLSSATARETRLRRSVQPILNDYDIVVCDCPPNLTIPTQNALALSTHYVVPISPDFLSGIGVALLLTRVGEFSRELEHQIVHAGIVISRFGRPAMHRDMTVESIRTAFPGLVLDQMIHDRVKVSEAAAKQKSVFQIGDPEAAAEFTAVAKDLIERLGA